MERKKKSDEKLSLILDHASRIFAEKGYHAASVRDVATATGVSPAGLYYYFQSKEELLHLILDGCLSSLIRRIRNDAAEIKNPAARLKAIIKIHLDQFRSSGPEMKVLVREWDVLSGPFGTGIRKLMRDYTQIVIRTFKELSPEKSSKELRAAAFGLFGMLTWVDQWYRPKRDLSLDRLAEEFTSIFLGHFLSGSPGGAGGVNTEEDSSSGKWTKKNPASSILSGPGF
jgi:AcrR family transcriptional regulator